MELEIPQLTKQERQKELSTLFDLGLVVKAFTGSLETLAGLFVAFTPRSFVLKIAMVVTEGELSTDPDDPVANAIRDAAHSFSLHTHFLFAGYLILHGLVKVVLVIAIFMGKKSAYPLFMGALIIFGSYELYRGIATHDLLLIALSAFDFSLFAITAYQYRAILKHEETPKQAVEGK
jgi:uncharacterized membrane protein